jgi:hypothetical protein
MESYAQTRHHRLAGWLSLAGGACGMAALATCVLQLFAPHSDPLGIHAVTIVWALAASALVLGVAAILLAPRRIICHVALAAASLSIMLGFAMAAWDSAVRSRSDDAALVD